METIDNTKFLEGWVSLDEVMNHLKNNIKTETRQSKIHGIGVFAIRDIKEGEELFPIWESKSGFYIIPNDRLGEIPKEVIQLLDMYFINKECGYKIIRLFNGLNFIHHTLCFCNSSYPNKINTNINNDGVAIRDIKKGEEILEYYTQNLNI